MKARRGWGRPLVPLYRAALALKHLLRRLGWLKQQRLTRPVISVGSLSAGGAGKTPVVLMLAKALTRRGYAPKILTRGYGRVSDVVERVNPEGDVRWFGDEPVLLAQRSGVPVFEAADRFQAGLLAEKDPSGGKIVVHLLDDGFQHRRLVRDVDIVLLTREEVEDHLLPAGNLREPLRMLRYADVIVLREEELAWTDEVAARVVRNDATKQIWVVRRQLRFAEGEDLPLRPVLFCGIAQQEGFFEMLTANGCSPSEAVIFKDHHAYQDRDVQRLVELARRSGADGFVTTEKDAVKLTPAMRAGMEAVGRVVVARLEVELVDEKQAIDKLIALVKPMERRKRR